MCGWSVWRGSLNNFLVGFGSVLWPVSFYVPFVIVGSHFLRYLFMNNPFISDESPPRRTLMHVYTYTFIYAFKSWKNAFYFQLCGERKIRHLEWYCYINKLIYKLLKTYSNRTNTIHLRALSRRSPFLVSVSFSSECTLQACMFRSPGIGREASSWWNPQTRFLIPKTRDSLRAGAPGGWRHLHKAQYHIDVSQLASSTHCEPACHYYCLCYYYHYYAIISGFADWRNEMTDFILDIFFYI